MSIGKARQGQAQPAGRWIRVEKRASIYERDFWQCAYCGRGPRDVRRMSQAGTVLSLDHLIPRSQGGANEAKNLITACLSCNSARRDRDWRDFAPGGAQERIEWLIEQPIDIDLGKAIIASFDDKIIEDAR